MGENRFARSVQAAKAKTTELEENKKIQETEKKVSEEQEAEETTYNPSKLDISKLFSDTPKKKKAYAKTFYMSESNMIKLENLAKTQNISVSKVLNEILNKIL